MFSRYLFIHPNPSSSPSITTRSLAHVSPTKFVLWCRSCAVSSNWHVFLTPIATSRHPDTMYAFVRFRDDGMKVAVAVERIKNFCPRNLRDFNSTKWYGVRWEDEENSGYFRAQIMKLFATKEEADACTEGVDKRFSCPKMPLYSDSEEDSFTSQESFREEKKNKQKAKSRQKNVEAAFRKKNMQILFPEEQDSRTNELEQEVLKLKSENSKLSARIEMLEKALCSKIFDAGLSSNFIILSVLQRSPQTCCLLSSECLISFFFSIFPCIALNFLNYLSSSFANVQVLSLYVCTIEH